MPARIGIDFGLNNCVTAVTHENGVRIIHYKIEEFVKPSVLNFRDCQGVLVLISIERFSIQIMRKNAIQ
jgi:molecular chaperone DnaK (HSP70)